MHISEATGDVAPRPAPAAGERELKFVLRAGRADILRRRLDSLCRRDPKYPSARVWTIYYDTPALVSLGEKLNSDYLKRKIRVRWYSDLAGRASGPAFIEAKLRIGNRRSKIRARLPYPADDMATWDLQDARLRDLPMLLRQHGVLDQEPWQPVMLIRYRRDRFVDRLTHTRVSLDAEISAVSMNPRYAPRIDPSPLAAAVLEVKGASEELPATLRPLLPLGIRKSSFSKLHMLYAHVTRQVI